MPEIVAGLRIATVSTVAIATFAFFAGAGGLGEPLYSDIGFKTNVIISGGLAILMAIAFDALLVVAGRFVSRRGERRVRYDAARVPRRVHGRPGVHLRRATAGIAGRGTVGGLDQIGDLTLDHLEVSALALAGSLLLALPVGIWLGHRGKGELLAVAIGNAGRAVPELALVAFMVAFVGVGLVNLTIALADLGIPPILTNTFVAIRQVDRDAVEARAGWG